MRGDILLYRSGGILKDRVVCAYTAGPFCHCEIDLGDGTTLGAHSEDGITRTREHLLERRIVISLQEAATAERIESGITRVLQHIGEPFSWASVADLVLPARLSTLLFGRSAVYNCSSLVARYLDLVGVHDRSQCESLSKIASPNDIARVAGLLPAAYGWRHTRVVRTAAALLALLPFPLAGHGTPRQCMREWHESGCRSWRGSAPIVLPGQTGGANGDSPNSESRGRAGSGASTLTRILAPIAIRIWGTTGRPSSKRHHHGPALSQCQPASLTGRRTAWR